MIDDSKIRRRYVRGERPARTPGFNGLIIPPDFAIYNAPRPLYASIVPVGDPPAYYRLEWSAPGPEGVFWVGIDLSGADPDDAGRIDANARLDAARVEFRSDQELFDAGYRYFTKHYPDGRVDQVLAERGDEARDWVIYRALQLLNEGRLLQ